MFASIVEIYCRIDEFCKEFKEFNAGSKRLLTNSDSNKRNRPSRMSISEITTIVVLCHMSGYRMFKH